MAAEEANVELLRLFLDQPDSLSVINAKVRHHYRAINNCTCKRLSTALLWVRLYYSVCVYIQMNVFTDVTRLILANIISDIQS